MDEKHLQFWKEKLAGELPVMELPVSKLRSGSPNYEGAFSKKEFSSQISGQISAITNKLQITGFTFFLTVFKILLYKYSGSLDLVVATPVTNRDRTQLEKVIGFFNETIILRSVLSEDMTFGEALNQVKNTVLEAFAHKNVPFESLVRSLRPERLFGSNPLFQVMFLYHKVPPCATLDEQISWDYGTMDLGVAKFDLTLYISEKDEQFTSIIEYATDRFEKSTIDRIHGHLQTLLEAILIDEDLTIPNLPILLPEERNQIIHEWNDNTSESAAESVVELISSVASSCPNKPAVLYQKNTLTYQSLQSAANSIVHELHKIGVGPGHTVGIAVKRSPEMVIAILGVLFSGAAYVPLDVNYPTFRLNQMAKDADVSVILTDSKHGDIFEGLEIELLFIDGVSDDGTPSVILPKIDAKDLAYIIYTSGSSGDPKGVPVSHGNLISSTSARFSYYPDKPKNFLLLSSFSFDSSVAGIFWTLCSGGALVIPEENLEQDLAGLGNLIYQTRVTHTLMLPSLYGLLLEHVSSDKLGSLNTVIVAGEACNASVCKSHFERLNEVNLYNEYGPSEATVWSTVHRLQPGDQANPIPIGRPIQNTQIFILNHSLQPVPSGIIGDLYIGGPGVVAGYLNNKELTSTKFIESPFNSENKILYKTGDLARYREDGTIEFLGRSDQQIKIRGYRIESTEIQNVIERYPGIKESAVVTQSSGSQDATVQADPNDLAQLTNLLSKMDPSEAEYLLASIESIDRFGVVDIKNNYGDD